MEENMDLICVEQGELKLTEETVQRIVTLEKEQKRIKAEYDALRKALKDAMAGYGLVSLHTDSVTLSFVEPTTREHFDDEAFREDFPELYDKYTELVPVAASIRVRVK